MNSTTTSPGRYKTASPRTNLQARTAAGHGKAGRTFRGLRAVRPSLAPARKHSAISAPPPLKTKRLTRVRNTGERSARAKQAQTRWVQQNSARKRRSKTLNLQTQHASQPIHLMPTLHPCYDNAGTQKARPNQGRAHTHSDQQRTHQRREFNATVAASK